MKPYDTATLADWMAIICYPHICYFYKLSNSVGLRWLVCIKLARKLKLHVSCARFIYRV